MRLSATLALILALAAGSDSDRGAFDWLVGCWASTDNSSQEVWVVDSETSLIGFGVVLGNDKVDFYEILSIKKSEDGSWSFFAHPSGQAAASFPAIRIGENSVVFANPDHDYPQEIRYRREGTHLYATASLLGGVNPNTFDKVACGS